MILSNSGSTVVLGDELPHVLHTYTVGFSTGNPGVFPGYPYPNPSLPVPAARGTGFDGCGMRVTGYHCSRVIFFQKRTILSAGVVICI